MSINSVTISGNLGADPELRQTDGGTQVLSLRVAVNERAKDPRTGEWGDRANWVDVTVFGNRAEPLSRFLSKGQKVAIEGKLRWSQWERDGQRRSKLEVIVDEVEFLSQRGAGQQGGDGYPSYATPAPTPAPQAPRPPVSTPPAADVYDEDIPF